MDLDSALTGKQFAEESAATDILRADHAEIRRLAQQYQQAKVGSPHARKALAEALRLQLDLHGRVEEEVFYPAVRDLNRELVQRAREDHGRLKAIAGNLEHLAPDDCAYERAVQDLIAQATRHIEAEERELFPAVEQHLGTRLRGLGRAIVELKKKLTGATEDVQGRA